MNRLIRENNQELGKTFTWTYDAGGNITSKTEYTYTTGTPSGGTTTNYTYKTGWKDQLDKIKVGNEEKQIFYDQIGNPITYGNKTFSWTRGRLLSRVVNGSQTVNLYYDATGRRTQKSIGTTYYDYFYDGDKLLQMSVQTPGSWDYMTFVYDSQGVMGFNYKGKNYIYVRNLFGDITDIYCEGDCVAKYKYDAWGNHTVYNPMTDEYSTDEGFVGNINPIRYRGYFYDTETGLYYSDSRYYSPEWGRFINASSVSNLQPQVINGLNLYVYASNNPMSGPYLVSSFAENTNTSILKNNRFASNSQSSIVLSSIPVWLDEVLTIIDWALSCSQIVIISSYTMKSGPLDNLLVAAIGARKYSSYLGFVESIGPFFVFIQTVIDVVYNLQQGYDDQYVQASASYTLVTGFITLGVSAIANAIATAAINTTVGGIVGFVVGFLFSLFFAAIKEDVI